MYKKVGYFCQAFTLSEVLLAIAVLGAVAALTMPPLISGYKHKIYVVQLEKSLSQIEQAMQNMMVRHECTDLVCTNVFDGSYDSNAWNNKIDEEFRKSIMVLRSYKHGERVSTSLRSVYLTPRASYTTDMDWNDPNGYKLMTHDGVLYFFKSKKCEITPFAKQSLIKNYCADVTIDINGGGLPNQYGRDIFKLMVAQNGHLYPIYGSEYSIAMYGENGLSASSFWKNSESACGKDNLLYLAKEAVSGEGCAARIIESVWKMTY